MQQRAIEAHHDLDNERLICAAVSEHLREHVAFAGGGS